MMKKIYRILCIICLTIVLNKVKAYEEYSIGDTVNYKNDSYYVIENSDSDTNYVTLLKAKPFTVDEINKYGQDENGELFINRNVINGDDPEKKIYEFPDGSGGVSFYNSDFCRAEYTWNVSSFKHNDSITNECKNTFEESDIKKLLDNWGANTFDSNDLIQVNDYKIRLLDSVDVYKNLNYDWSKRKDYSPHINVLEWFKPIPSNSSIWTMILIGNLNVNILIKDYISSDKVFSVAAVDPVINLSKCSLNDLDSRCNIIHDEPMVCAKKVTKYKKYNVCDEVEYKGNKYYVIDGGSEESKKISLLKKEALNLVDIQTETNSDENSSFLYTLDFGMYVIYNFSIAKNIVDNWASNNVDLGDLVEVRGAKVRIPDDYDYEVVENKDLLDYGVDYWKMHYSPNNSGARYLVVNGLETKAIIPVINLSKDKIDNLEIHSIGDIILYKDNNYKIIYISDDDYVTLMKEKPLMSNELNLFDVRLKATYDSSLRLISEWSLKYKSDLTFVDGYKEKFLSVDDLIEKFGFENCHIVTHDGICKSEDSPDCLDTDYSYWLMYNFQHGQSHSYVVDSKDAISAIRPVINLNKCAIDDGCFEEENYDEYDDFNKYKNVEIENTLKNNSYVVVVLGVLLIIIGYVLYKYKFKKNNN